MENQIYDYLLQNCLGYKNRIKGRKLMDLFDIKDHKTLRSYIEKTRQDEKYEYLVGSEAGSSGGYFIPINSEEKEISTKHIRLRAEEQLKTYENMERKKIYEVENFIQ